MSQRTVVMETKEQFITPEIAKDLLDNHNPRNRPFKPHVVDQYTNDMINGRWKRNGEPICKDWNGNILNGQHRLAAIVKSGIGQMMLVVDGLDPESRDTYDVNAGRSNSDTLSLEGVRNAKDISAALIIVEDLMVGNNSYKRFKKYSNVEIKEVFSRHTDIVESVKWGRQLKSYISSSVTISHHYLFSKVDKARSNEFFELFRTGAGMEEGHPILQLRARLILIKPTLDKVESYTKRRTQSALLIKAWNLFLAGRTAKILNFNNNHTFPDISGI